MTRRNSDSKDGPPPPPENQNVFDDEFALDPDEDDFMPSVSDGFRPPMMEDSDAPPNNNNTNSNRTPSNHDAPPSRTQSRSSSSATKPTETDLRRVATRNSTAKIPNGQDPAAAADRHAMPTQPYRPSPSPLRNRDSISSAGSFATTAQSELGTGPSHPYAMYAQNTVVRSPSISMVSTQPQPETPVAMQRPAHPYAMYTQNVVVEDEPPVPQTQNTIPLGFAGINPAVGPGYRRQIGPDGEEQDIIGPDGHTEQLPPYSRYPEEGPTKASLAAEASASSVGTAAAALNVMDESNETPLSTSDIPSPSSPVSPINHVIAPPTSINPALLPPRRPETQTGNAADPRPATTSESASLLTSADESTVNEKANPSSEKKIPWQKRKLWGKIPISMALVAVILLMIFALILGATMGTVIVRESKQDKMKEREKHKNNHQDPLSQNAPSNTLYDATPIATTTGLPSLPLGQFSLPLGFAQESSPGCLALGNQYAAWSCKMSFAPLILTVMANDKLSLSLESFQAPDGSIQYGLQPPLASNQTLQLVSDLDYRGYGPAWHFSTRYDKVVVLTPDEFTAGPFLRSRQMEKSYRHRFQVQPGDNPWLCYWNQTYIEGYIYVHNNSTAATVTGYPTPNPTDPYGPMQLPSTTGSPSPTTITNVPIPTSTASRGSGKRDDSPPPFPRLPPYPRTVKIEERRVAGAPPPYCQKMQLLDNGKLSPVTSTKGDKIVVSLQEQDPVLAEYGRDRATNPSSTARRKMRLDKRRDPPDACHCQWMFQ